MKIYLIRSVVIVLLGGLLSCAKETAKPLSDQIRQVWTVNVAKENATVVYTKTGTANIRPGYAQYRLDLSNTQQQTVRLTEIDNLTFVGTWALSADNTQLTLSNLAPQPTGSNGIVEYTVESGANETVLTITRTAQNLKTGSTNTRYELVK